MKQWACLWAAYTALGMGACAGEITMDISGATADYQDAGTWADAGIAPAPANEADEGTRDVALPTPPPNEGSDTPDARPEPPREPYTCAGREDFAGDDVLWFGARRALIHVPADYDPSRGTMLVFSFHGFGSADWQQVVLTGMNPLADERNFIVVYPDGVANSWNAGTCCGTAWFDAVDDVAFVDQMIDEISDRFCIDPDRVYATGMSNGGFMSHRLACELSDRIAAIAPVAGVLGLESCDGPRSVPVMQFHGTNDPIVPFTGGTPIIPDLGVGLVFASIEATMELWRVKNGCSAETVTYLDIGDTQCVEWVGCESDTRLCTTEDGGHSWPGGLPIPTQHTTRAINASEEMIDFFERHPMPR